MGHQLPEAVRLLQTRDQLSSKDFILHRFLASLVETCQQSVQGERNWAETGGVLFM